MILKGNIRGGPTALAKHLANEIENDHIDLNEVRGLASESLFAALHEIDATNQSRSPKSFYHLSLNPPHEAAPTVDDFHAAIGAAEQRLNLHGQPRVVVFHEKQGRRHAHVAWSRVDGKTGKMIRHSWDRYCLKNLSAELYRHFGWTMPIGLEPGGKAQKTNFGHDDWMVSKRTGISPAEHKRMIAAAYDTADSIRGFSNALVHQGYILAGGRRGYVAVDIDGNPHSVPRAVGKKKAEVEARLGDPTENVPTVDQVQVEIRERRTSAINRKIEAEKVKHAQRLQPLNRELKALRGRQKAERRLLTGWESQERSALETRLANRYRQGVLGFWDRLTGRRRRIEEQNRADSDTFSVTAKAKQHAMIQKQISERRRLQIEMASIARQHKEELDELRQDVATLIAVDHGTQRNDGSEHVLDTDARDRQQRQVRESHKQSRGRRRSRGYARRPGSDIEPGDIEPA